MKDPLFIADLIVSANLVGFQIENRIATNSHYESDIGDIANIAIT